MRKQRNWNDDEKQNKGRITRIRKKIRNKMIIKLNKTRKIKKIRKNKRYLQNSVYRRENDNGSS